MDYQQYIRKATLIVMEGTKALDLSDMHFRFKVASADIESPNNASIRVYNLSKDTSKLVRDEFSRVILQAGYEGSFGVIFDGTIRQFKLGRESAVDTYLDLLAADGDIAYNFATIAKTLSAPNTTPDVVVANLVDTLRPHGVEKGSIAPPSLGGTKPNPRGKVMFGMTRVIMRQYLQSLGQTWNIQNGKVNVIPLEGYLPTEAVELTALTGLVGLPEQTNDGISARCLLNPRLIAGGLVKIDNASINKILQQNPQGAPIPYNTWRGLQLLASTTEDGLYRVFAVDHEGDTRGQAWYSDLVCLAISPGSQKVVNPDG